MHAKRDGKEEQEKGKTKGKRPGDCGQKQQRTDTGTLPVTTKRTGIRDRLRLRRDRRYSLNDREQDAFGEHGLVPGENVRKNLASFL